MTFPRHAPREDRALDALPEAYGPSEYEALVEAVYGHVFDSYWGDGKSKYAPSEK